MRLTGAWQKDLDIILGQIHVACGNIASQLKQLPRGLTKQVAIQLYNDVSAVAGALINLTKQEPASSQVACVMLRTLLEGGISVFAFCKDPEQRGKLYWNYLAVLDWKHVCLHEKNFGCPLISGDQAHAKNVAERKKSAKGHLRNLGEVFIIPKKGQRNKQRLLEALAPGNELRKWFRDRWFPETRREVLNQERMGWVYDVVYTRLCSSVHSDSAASKVFAGIERGHILMVGLEFWGAAIYKLVETFRFNLSADHKGTLRYLYTSLQWAS